MVARNKWIVRIYDNYGTYDEALSVIEFGNDFQDALEYMDEYNETHEHTYAAFPVEVDQHTSREDLFIDLPF